MTTILAFDQATQKTGWAIIRDGEITDYGLIKKPAREPQRWMRHQMRQVLRDHDGVEAVAFEAVQLTSQKGTGRALNAKTALLLAEFRGACVGMIEDMGLPVITITSNEMSRELHLGIGAGRASKKYRAQFFATAEVHGTVQASDGARQLLQEDIADAIILARIAYSKVVVMGYESASADHR